MTHDISSFIEKLYCEHYKKLYTYAFSILRHRIDAEATVQEAFATACGVASRIDEQRKSNRLDEKSSQISGSAITG